MEKNKLEDLTEETLNKAFNQTKQKLEDEPSNKQKAKQEEKSKQNENIKGAPSKQDGKSPHEEKSNEEAKDKKQDRNVSCEEYLKLKYQLADAINKYKQLDKEFENYRTRTREEIKQSTTNGLVKAIELMLPALDSFKKAKQIVKDPKNLEGINLIEKSLMTALEKQGVKKIDCIGKPFNTDFHNAVALIEDKTKKSGIIIDEVESGYTLGEKVIKFSQVIVNK